MRSTLDVPGRPMLTSSCTCAVMLHSQPWGCETRGCFSRWRLGRSSRMESPRWRTPNSLLCVWNETSGGNDLYTCHMYHYTIVSTKRTTAVHLHRLHQQTRSKRTVATAPSLLSTVISTHTCTHTTRTLRSVSTLGSNFFWSLCENVARALVYIQLTPVCRSNTCMYVLNTYALDTHTQITEMMTVRRVN